ncbi:MAG: ABC transporter substrate-binding protein [Syntrophobacterales bacterium]|nr:MAG: ABC transporter substrate-binding protein [Syntrophobacterales bacterium]
MEKTFRSTVRAFFAIAFFLLIFWISEGFGQGTPVKVTLMLDWFPNADHVPIYVARDKGFFRKEDLDVEILVPANPNDPPKLVAVGKVDFGISYQPSVTVARSRELPIKAIGVLVEHPLSTITFLKESGIRTPADLRGKRVGYSTAPTEVILFEAVAQAAGLSKEDYELINIGFNLTPSLLTGKVDAVVGAYWNYEINELALEGIDAGYFAVEKHGVPDYYELVFIANDGTLKTKREVAVRFIKAIDGAIQFTKRHPEEALKIYFQANPNVRKELDTRAFRDTLTVFAATQVQSLGKWKGFLDFAFERGLIQMMPSPETLFENVLR